MRDKASGVCARVSREAVRLELWDGPESSVRRMLVLSQSGGRVPEKCAPRPKDASHAKAGSGRGDPTIDRGASEDPYAVQHVLLPV